jgi:hypothetical protein
VFVLLGQPLLIQSAATCIIIVTSLFQLISAFRYDEYDTKPAFMTIRRFGCPLNGSQQQRVIVGSSDLQIRLQSQQCFSLTALTTLSFLTLLSLPISPSAHHRLPSVVTAVLEHFIIVIACLQMHGTSPQPVYERKRPLHVFTVELQAFEAVKQQQFAPT